MSSSNNQSLASLLFLMHRIPVNTSLTMISDWLKSHPQETKETLATSFHAGKIIVKNEQLFELPVLSFENAKSLVDKIQQQKILEVKDRWYHFKRYPMCFIGSELVDCLTTAEKIASAEAVFIGQSLLEHHLISHVCDDHEFKNDFLFYRFRELS